MGGVLIPCERLLQGGDRIGESPIVDRLLCSGQPIAQPALALDAQPFGFCSLTFLALFLRARPLPLPRLDGVPFIDGGERLPRNLPSLCIAGIQPQRLARRAKGVVPQLLGNVLACGLESRLNSLPSFVLFPLCLLGARELLLQTSHEGRVGIEMTRLVDQFFCRRELFVQRIRGHGLAGAKQRLRFHQQIDRLPPIAGLARAIIEIERSRFVGIKEQCLVASCHRAFVVARLEGFGRRLETRIDLFCPPSRQRSRLADRGVPDPAARPLSIRWAPGRPYGRPRSHAHDTERGRLAAPSV